MKFNEQFENSGRELPQDPEFLLVSKQINNFLDKIVDKLSKQPPEKIELVKAILNKKYLKDIYVVLENKYEELSELSEKLIDSTNSESPEVRKKRKIVADELNQIMEQQEKMNPFILQIDSYEEIISLASKEKIDEAQKLVSSMYENIDIVLNPRTDLN